MKSERYTRRVALRIALGATIVGVLPFGALANREGEEPACPENLAAVREQEYLRGEVTLYEGFVVSKAELCACETCEGSQSFGRRLKLLPGNFAAGG